MSSFTQRLTGAAKLNSRIYEEVEHDSSANGQAMGVVLLSAICAGIGGSSAGGVGGLIGLALAGLLGWLMWAAVIYLVGYKKLASRHTKTDMGQLLRTLGFAQAPGLLLILGALPLLGPLVGLVVRIWLLCAMVVAVRQALDYDSTLRAVVVVVLGFFAYALAFAVVYALLGISI